MVYIQHLLVPQAIYIPVPNVTLLRQYLTLPAFDRFHLLDIQLSISGAILTEYKQNFL